ncbi:MAG: hypothetical protein AAFY10_13420, partial [Pseudomonadota bacterium]
MSDSASPSEPPRSAQGHGHVTRVRTAGQWMPWASFVLAVLWWACVAAALVTSFDLNVVFSQPPITLAAGAVMALLPGLLIIMAGFMARESARGALANSLVLQASGQLLSPSNAVAGDAQSLAEHLSTSAKEVDHAMAQALGAMKALSSEIGDERLRLESVSYATADNARDLTSQLSQERAALESLIRDLRAQGETMNEAIPRQAQHMVQAARQAADEIGKADEALDQRLASMRQASESLGAELARLNQMAGEAGVQSESLMHSIARVEEKLDHSKRTVDAAVRASEAAVTAAGSTGEALQAAVSSALDDARRASLEIQKRTRESSEEAALQIQVLRQTAEQAGSALKDVSAAARSKAETLPPRIETPAAEEPNGFSPFDEPEAPAPERPALTAETPLSQSPRPAVSPPLTPPPSAPPTAPSVDEDTLFASPPPRMGASGVDTDLFEAPEPVRVAPPEPEIPVLRTSFEPSGGPLSQASQIETTREERDAPPPFDPPVEAGPEREPNANETAPTPREPKSRDAGWSTILSDIDRGD